jgi:two-component system CheB/CheR fusion protein
VSEQHVKDPPAHSEAGDFPIVAIGASAGGLESLERFFSNLPPDTGMAFVVLQHLSPDFKSLMDELLRRRTSMPIHHAESGTQVQPNTVYLLPPMKEMIIRQRQLLLSDRDPRLGLTLPIDMFYRSLAQDVGKRAVAIVLSGSGSDGSREQGRRHGLLRKSRVGPVQWHAPQRDAHRNGRSRAFSRGDCGCDSGVGQRQEPRW